MNLHERKSGIVNALGSTQTAAYCLKLIDALYEVDEAEGKFLTFTMLQKMVGCDEIDSKFVEAVQFLTSSTYSVLHAHGQFVDIDGSEFTLSDQEFNEVLLSGSLIHPRTGDEIKDARGDVIPFFSLNTLERGNHNA